MPSNLSPSHFNSGMTATAQPQAPTAAQEEPQYVPPWAPPEDRKRSTRARRGLLLAVIAILAVLLVGVTFESGFLGTGGGPTGPAVNSASNPMTGEQLLSAYSGNASQATASYTNKTVYIKDSLDFGVGRDLNTGQYYSTLDSGAVVLEWNSQSQVGQLYPGAVVLAKCSVEGVQSSPLSGSELYLQDCVLISVQSQTGTASATVSVNND